MAFLETHSLSKHFYGEKPFSIEGLDLSVDQGEFLVLLGESGCGKTTILKLIAGLEEQDEGSVDIDGKCMNGIPPNKRPISMVFQKALLFRNMTVEKNVNFAPRINHTASKAELRTRTQEMLELVGLKDMGKKRVTELSGGQEQRVSLARALMTDPKVLLLDEPLSALDATLRESMQTYIRRLNKETGVTMIMVTHDQREAATMADSIALIRNGVLEEKAAPTTFYQAPGSRYAAEFFGWKNFIDKNNDRKLVDYLMPRMNKTDVPKGSLLAVRPDAVCNIGQGTLEGNIEEASYQGLTVLASVRCNNTLLRLQLPISAKFEVGSSISFDLEPTSCCMLSE